VSLFAYVKLNEAEIRDLQRRVAVLEQQVKQ
jgi:hypothetical protein